VWGVFAPHTGNNARSDPEGEASCNAPELVVGRNGRVVVADGEKLILDLVEGGEADTAHNVAVLQEAISELLAAGIAIALEAANELAAVSENVEGLLGAGRKFG
jgi:hypothetical protein